MKLYYNDYIYRYLCPYTLRQFSSLGLVFTFFKICIITSPLYHDTEFWISNYIYPLKEIPLYWTQYGPKFPLYLSITGYRERDHICHGRPESKQNENKWLLEYMLRKDWEWLVFNTYLVLWMISFQHLYKIIIFFNCFMLAQIFKLYILQIHFFLV